MHAADRRAPSVALVVALVIIGFLITFLALQKKIERALHPLAQKLRRLVRCSRITLHV